MKTFSVLYFMLLVIIPAYQADTLCSLGSCKSSEMTGTVLELCQKQNHTILNKCCIEGTNKTIVGLDIDNCSISNLDVLSSANLPEGVHMNFTLLKYLDLNQNPLGKSDFENLGYLEFLNLPASFDCPGGKSAWKTEEKQNASTQCYDAVNLCKTENVECPSNSSCVMHSPGESWCQCDAGFYGYKCSRQGNFPVVEFISTLVAGTLMLSATSWTVLRRKAKTI